MWSNAVIRSEVKEASFGLYSDVELKRLSVAKITSPVTRDTLGNALSGGLYDPRMGAVDRGVLCATCGLNDLNCPGHPGHLELDFPVYHPLLFASVFQLVRSSCSCCHRLRLSNSHIWPYLAKLKLLEMDDVVGAEEIDDKLLPQTMFDGVDVEDGDGEEAEPEGEDLDDTMAMDEAKGDSSEDERPRKKAPAQKRPSRRPGAGSSSSGVGRGAFDSTPEPELDASAILADVDSRFRAYCRRRNRRPPGVFARNKQQEVIAAFNRECIKVKKCEVCGERSPTIRKDGYTKMFAKPLPKNAAKLTSKNRLLYGGYTALEHVQKEEAGEQVGAVPDDSDIDSDMDEPAEVYDGLVDNSSEDEEEEDEESESEGEEEAKGGESVSRSSDKGKAAAKNKVSKKGKGDAAVVADEYLAPEQVEATLKLLWRYHPEILDAVHGRAQRGLAAMETPSAEGWRVFFLRAILVPANRFRPEAIVGDTQSDHPQNLNLAKIIETNQAIRQVHRKQRLLAAGIEEEEQGAEEAGTSATLADLVNQSSSSSSGSGSGSSAGNSAGNSAQSPSAAAAAAKAKNGASLLSQSLTLLIQLQNHVNCYMDSAKDPNPLGGNQAQPGIRQILERKEGLFRKNMMGKRVNYCCRSVISPDPYIGTNEVGLPLHFAKSLHYPEPVNEYNVKRLRALVERGPFKYPGANMLKTGDGTLIKLDKLNDTERAAKAKLLLQNPGAKVFRHIVNGDMLLVNRQPSLHKASIMAHKARILTHISEQTIRLHYANCNSYNADFDGDEMNCHLVQNEAARAECDTICDTDSQYVGPTSGAPLRGLIQDHVASAVKLTCRNTFLTKDAYQQLLFVALDGLPGTEIVGARDSIVLPAPAIFKGRGGMPFWTGKQVISGLLMNLIRPPVPALNLTGKTRTPPTALGPENAEHMVVVRANCLLAGVLDKAAIGSTSMGLVHSVYELYGARMAGLLLNSFGRLFTYHLRDAGHTCGLEDLVLTEAADAERRKLLVEVEDAAGDALQEFIAEKEGTNTKSKPQNGGSSSSSRPTGLDPNSRRRCEAALRSLKATLGGDAKPLLDSAQQATINKSASAVIKACLPNGLLSPFLKNSFSVMVLTGAKGSAVNQSQISCFLGQQALEGQRVPVMVSGKTLPSFRPYDASIRAGGFIRDRFLTGVKPQEYYFHCMAGREGLVDTAVKTSRSGYLQRCLVKHLEELKVAYDNTVRDSSGNVVQFLYGEDGQDPTKATLLSGKTAAMTFLVQNYQALLHKYGVDPESYFERGELEVESAYKYKSLLRRAKAALGANCSDEGVRAPVKKPAALRKAVVMARRRRGNTGAWNRGNLVKGVWEAAEVIKVKDKSGAKIKGAAANNILPVDCLVDIRYRSDGAEAHGVPCVVLEEPNRTAEALPEMPEGQALAPLAVPMVQFGLPDPALNNLPLATAVGACSERLQTAIGGYVESNPDGALAAAPGEVSLSGGTIVAEQIETLMWIKFMRAMAAPGEAVGSVAAQSVGEPSTQMTLNTFHLAGHGGANVTLGIPRLREIVMTASKNLKTPTMTLPLLPHCYKDNASAGNVIAARLARQFTVVPLGELLHHQAGVEVGERLERDVNSKWVRRYRIRLLFEPSAVIKRAFGISFREIVGVTAGKFKKMLLRLVSAEQKKTEKNANVMVSSAPVRARKAFKRGGDDESGDEEGRAGDNDDDNAPDGGPSGTADNSGGDRDLDNLFDSDSEEEDEEDDDSAVGKSRDKDLGLEEEEEDGGVHAMSAELAAGADLGSDSDDEAFSLPQAASAPAAKGKGKDESKGRPSAKDKAAGAGKKASKGGQTKAVKEENDDEDDLSFDEAAGWCELVMEVPASRRRLLMTGLVERAANATKVRSTPNINKAYAAKTKLKDPASGEEVEVPAVTTKGVNFEAVWKIAQDSVDLNNTSSNDIYKILLTYGVEAARESIVREIVGVFSVYGIDVNPRHLSLIADFMTRTGSYVAMNRAGMNECSSPFLQMSFETTCTFLTKAAQAGATDNLDSPSSRIVLGRPINAGTGAMDVMIPLDR